MTGTTMGSVYYMSPEQIQGVATLDGRADIYSVGVTLYELVTGKRPFDGESQYSIMAAHLEKTPVPPIALDPRLPQALNDAILMAVSKDPNARFQTAGAFRNALIGVAGTIPTSPVPVPSTAPAPVAPVPAAVAPVAAAAALPPQPIASPSKSKRWLWMSIGGVAAAAAIVCAIEFAPWKPTHAAVPAAQTSEAQAQPSPAPPETATAPSTPPPDSGPAAVPTQAPPTATPVAPPPAAVPTQAPPTATPVAPPPSAVPAHAPPIATPVAPPPTAPAGPSRAQILQAREHFAKLQVRAGSIRDSLGNLKRTMQSQGMALNAKFTQPEGLMETYLRSAEQALNQSDLTAAKEYGDKAERQIEVLEKLLNL
jgi:serine/threonine-protein kinase